MLIVCRSVAFGFGFVIWFGVNVCLRLGVLVECSILSAVCLYFHGTLSSWLVVVASIVFDAELLVYVLGAFNVVFVACFND